MRHLRSYKIFEQDLEKYYDEESDEYYDIIDIDFSKLRVSKRSINGAYDNYTNGRKTKSSDLPLNIWISEDNDNEYYIVDGYHRLIEYLIEKKKTGLKGIIVGSGYSDYYQEPKGDNLIYLNEKFKITDID